MAEKDLLIELGCEELPAGVGKPAAEALREKVIDLLVGARLLATGTAHEYNEYWTPRRLAVIITAVKESGEASTAERVGPAVKAAFGPDGQPTKAAIGFAKSCGLEAARLRRVKTEKGEYVAATITLPAVTLAALLAKELPGIVAGLPMPKAMRWNATQFKFSRPLRWLVVIHGSEVVPVEIAGLKAGNESRGHRSHSGGKCVIPSAAAYEETLHAAFVIPNPYERRETIRVEAKQVSTAGIPLDDYVLLSEVADLVEYPCPFKADFDPRYLQIPAPVLVGAMKKHQRYFPVYHARKPTELLPCFIGVANGDEKQYDLNAVREGNNRVLRARFDDAEFFFKNDTAKKLADFLPKLDGIMYEKRLGSIGDKVRRIQKLTEWLLTHVPISETEKVEAREIARLCKADLATQMVFEFPELQGEVGREYALREGIAATVAAGIQMHYWPIGDRFVAGPTTPSASVVALADKFDTVAGGFATGKEPTGSADPYALRRQAIGILRILKECGWRLPIREAVAQALGLVAEKVPHDRDAVLAKVMAFIEDRLKTIVLGTYQHDELAAVLARPWRDLHEVIQKLVAVEALKASPAYDDIVTALKRVLNISKDVKLERAEPDPTLYQAPIEGELWGAAKQLAAELGPVFADRRYGEALARLVTLRPLIDRLFTDVMVMDKDPKVRANRLALVKYVADLFLKIADLTQLVVKEEPK